MSDDADVSRSLSEEYWAALEQEAGADDDQDWQRFEQILQAVAADVNPIRQRPAPSDHSTLPPSTSSKSASAPFECWGKYLLREKVGQGGFGAVFRAWDPMLEHEVAIKILDRRVSDARLRDELLIEGRALARIDHPNVVRVLGIEAQDDQFALCMEFLRGDTLESIVEHQGTLNVREATLIGEDVCRALTAVHNAGFIHRDVKARNVMRQQAGRIVLMDFGAGRSARDLERSGSEPNIGTPAYMAPELFESQPATKCSDVYSVGVLLYYLVTGSYPIEGPRAGDIRRAHREGRRTPLLQRRPDLPSHFARIVQRALSPDPTQRFTDAGALLTALLSRDTPAPAASTRTTLLRGAAGVCAVLAAAAALGVIISAAFNVTMERIAPFDAESPIVVVRWGLRSLVAPALYIGIILLVLRVVREGAAHLRLDAPIGRLASRFGPKTPTGVAYLGVGVGIVGLCATMWYFRDLLDACTTTGLVNASREKLAQVEHGHAGPFYRLSLYVLLTMFLLIALHIRSAARDDMTSGLRAPTYTVAGMFALTLILSAGPYRILWGNKVERYDVAGERCYPIGRSGGRMQVFCPDREPPRTRIVDTSSPDVHETGIVESLFTDASRGAKAEGSER